MQGMVGRTKPFFIIVPDAALTYQQVSAIVIDVATPYLTFLAANVLIVEQSIPRVSMLRTHIVYAPAYDARAVTRLATNVVYAPAYDAGALTLFRTNVIYAAAQEAVAVTQFRADVLVAAVNSLFTTYARTNVITCSGAGATVSYLAANQVVSLIDDVAALTQIAPICLVVPQRSNELSIIDQSPPLVFPVDDVANLFVVAVVGDSNTVPIFYQWEFFNPSTSAFEEIAGAVDDTLAATAEDSGNIEYRCRVYTLETTLFPAATVYSNVFKVVFYQTEITAAVADILTTTPPIINNVLSGLTLDVLAVTPPALNLAVSGIIVDTLTVRLQNSSVRTSALLVDVLTHNLEYTS